MKFSNKDNKNKKTWQQTAKEAFDKVASSREERVKAQRDVFGAKPTLTFN